MENTTRGSGWRFLEIGRRMERALQAAELLRGSLASAADDLEACLRVLLQIADSSITYRSRHPMGLQASLVLKLLIVDESNPRSLGFQLATLLHQIIRLQQNEPEAETSTEHQLAVKALNSVRSSEATDLCWRDSDGNFNGLEGLVGGLKGTLWELSDAITARYFSNLLACRFTASY
jgi:uncharacterized alpha-E superfamily protein